MDFSKVIFFATSGFSYILLAISIILVMSVFYLFRQSINTSSKIERANSGPEIEKHTENGQTSDIQSLLPYIDRLIQSQSKPLESIEKFYSYLELEGFTFTPELKEAIKKEIENKIDDKEKTKKKEQISAELFGSPTVSAPTPPQPASGTQVIPLPAVPPGSTCQVCLSEFSTAEPGAVKCPHCGNLFHYRCIAKWINKNGTCPVCRKDLKA